WLVSRFRVGQGARRGLRPAARGTDCAMDLFIFVVHLRRSTHCLGSRAASSKIATRTGHQRPAFVGVRSEAPEPPSITGNKTVICGSPPFNLVSIELLADLGGANGGR